MEWKQLVAGLEPYGVPELEARLYFHLSRLGPSRAADVAREAAVARTDVYRLLESLHARGFVQKTLERPARFVPLPIDEALDRAVLARRREVERLETTQDDLVAAWPDMPVAAPGGRRFSVYQGRDQVRGLLDRMLTHAQEEIVVVSSMRGLHRLDAQAVADRLLRCQEAGVGVRFMTQIEADDLGPLERMAAACQVRHVDLSEYHQLIIIDSREVALFVSAGGRRDGGDTVLWLNSPTFVMAQRALVDRTWSRGWDFDARRRELLDGVPVERWEALHGRWIRIDRMKQLFLDAPEIRIQVPAIEIERWARAGVLRLLERRLLDDVTIHVTTDHPVQLPFGIDVEVRPLHGPGFIWARGQGCLIVEGIDKDGDAITSEGESSVWTNHLSTMAWLARQHLVEAT